MTRTQSPNQLNPPQFQADAVISGLAFYITNEAPEMQRGAMRDVAAPLLRVLAVGAASGAALLAAGLANHDTEVQAATPKTKVIHLDRHSSDFGSRFLKETKNIDRVCSAATPLSVSPPDFTRAPRRGFQPRSGAVLSLTTRMNGSGERSSTLSYSYKVGHKLCARLVTADDGDVTIMYNQKPTGYNKRTKRYSVVNKYKAANGGDLPVSSATIWVTPQSR